MLSLARSSSKSPKSALKPFSLKTEFFLPAASLVGVSLLINSFLGFFGTLTGSNKMINEDSVLISGT